MTKPTGEARASAEPEGQAGGAAPASEDPPPPPPRRGPPLSRLQVIGEWVTDVARGVWRKGEQDQVFFLAGAISFDILVAFVPLLLTMVGVAGVVLRRWSGSAQQVILDYVSRTMPEAVNVNIAAILENLAAQSTGILSIGTIFFLWISTRLIGTLRHVLREIFDIPEGRGIVAGKLFDIKMVLAAGTLFALNIGLTFALNVSATVVAEGLHIDPDDVPYIDLASQLWPQLVAFVTIWVMFLLIYRYLPPRRIRWATAAIAATFTAVIGEALKFGFSWYITGIADFRSTWGNIATFIILVIWIYYTAIVFILGGEVAQVVSMQRTRRRQKERLA